MTDHDRQDEVLRPPRIPAAAMWARPHAPRAPGRLFLLTLLGTVDGTLVVLAAAGRLATLGGALVVGLTVVAGAGSWVAARDVFGGRLDRRAARWLGVLGAVTAAATLGSVWLGTHLGTAVGMHVLPKAAGLALVLLGLELTGLRLPRPGRVPLPGLVLGAALLAEVAWTLS